MTTRHDPFARSRIPTELDRVGRVAMVREVARSLIDGRMPSRGAALFVAGALLSWLADSEQRRDLVRDYLRLRACRGSRWTPQEIFDKLERTEHAMTIDSRASHSETCR